MIEGEKAGMKRRSGKEHTQPRPQKDIVLRVQVGKPDWKRRDGDREASQRVGRHRLGVRLQGRKGRALGGKVE